VPRSAAVETKINTEFDIDSLSQEESVIPIEGVKRRLLEVIFSENFALWFGHRYKMANPNKPELVGEKVEDLFEQISSHKVEGLDQLDNFFFAVAYLSNQFAGIDSKKINDVLDLKYVPSLVRSNLVNELQKFTAIRFQLTNILLNSDDGKSITLLKDLSGGEKYQKDTSVVQKPINSSDLITALLKIKSSVDQAAPQNIVYLRQDSPDPQAILKRIFGNVEKQFEPERQLESQLQAQLATTRENKEVQIVACTNGIRSLFADGYTAEEIKIMYTPIFASFIESQDELNAELDRIIDEQKPSEQYLEVKKEGNIKVLDNLFRNNCNLTENSKKSWEDMKMNSSYRSQIAKMRIILEQMLDHIAEQKKLGKEKIDFINTVKGGEKGNFGKHKADNNGDYDNCTIFKIHDGNRMIVCNVLQNGKIVIKNLGQPDYKH
jgi:hypothetical protein